MLNLDQAMMVPEEDADDDLQVADLPQGYKLGDDFEQMKDASIMMIDDEPITMEVVRTFLEDAGYRKFILVEDSTQAHGATAQASSGRAAAGCRHARGIGFRHSDHAA